MKITILPVALLLVLSICSCAKTWMEDKTADTSAVDNSDAVTSISVTPQSAEPGVYTELADFLTEEKIQLYILSAKVDALPESAEKARFKYALIGGSPIVYVFDDDMRFYLAYLNIDMHFASVYECTLMLPAGYTDGRFEHPTYRRGAVALFCLATEKPQAAFLKDAYRGMSFSGKQVQLP